MMAAAAGLRRAVTRHGCTLAVGVACLAIGAVAAEPATATVTFGADLSQPANLSFHCSVPPPFFGPYRPPSPYAFPDTCTAFTVGNFGGGGVGSQLVPNGSGEITKVRISEPPATFDPAAGSTFGPLGPLGQSGPLKVSVLEALRQGQSSTAVCCTVPRESAPFNVLMGGVTEITLNPPLPVQAIVTATGVYQFDAIALTAVGADSVIPAGQSSSASSGGYYPAVQPGQERYEQETSFGSADTVSPGTQIMMQADWEPVADASTPTPGSPATPAPTPAAPAPTVLPLPRPTTLTPVAPVQIAGNDVARVLANQALLNLACRLTSAPCVGQVQLQNLPAQAAKKGARKPHLVVYGSGSFNIPAGKQARTRVRLRSAGKQLLKRRRTATVWATFKTQGVGAAAAPPIRMTLTR